MTNLNTCSFDGCEKPRRGLFDICDGHYQQARKGKELSPLRPKLSREEALRKNILKTETCWLWVGYMDGHGYGSFWSDGKKRLAHRYMWECANGPIPSGVDIDHLCHTPACVNVEHLRATTHRQNLQHRKGPNSNNTSGYLGVSWHAGDRKWRARVKDGSKTHYVGNFDTPEDAAEAARLKRLDLFTHNDRDR